MSTRILVTYATKAGSTGEVAEYIGDVLRKAGLKVDVYPAKQAKNLSPYSAVVLGTGVRSGHIFSEAVGFVTRHREILPYIPTAYFLVCLTMTEDTSEQRQIASGYLEPLREVAEPISTGLFGGRIDHSKLELPWRLLLRNVKDGPMAGGDWRNWQAIRQWANELIPLLTGEVAVRL
jgi:menaquinone-dependent protoporphyrinogen oxidase